MAERPLIPRTLLFGNPSRVEAKISPDGQWLTWLAPRDGVLNIWLSPADDLNAATPLTRVTKRPIGAHAWACDGRHVLYMDDENGDENWRLYAVDRTSAEVRDLTPLRGIAGQFLMCSPDRPDTVLVGLNDRDKRWHDVWSVDLATGQRKLVFENTHELVGFVFDWQLNLRLARQARPGGDGGLLFRFVSGKPEPFLEIPAEDELTTGVVMVNRAGNSWSMLSSIGRDRTALYRVDALTGAQTLLAEHPKADIVRAIVDNVTGEVDAVAANYVREEWTVINPAIADDLSLMRERFAGAEFRVGSQSDDNSRWVVATHRAEEPATYFLYDRKRREVKELFAARPELKSYRLLPMHGHVIKSRDGLNLVSYLTLPAGESGSVR